MHAEVYHTKATTATTRPHSSKPKSKKENNQNETRKARLGCGVCYLSKSETGNLSEDTSNPSDWIN